MPTDQGTITLDCFGERRTLEVTVELGDVRLVDLLPPARALSDEMTRAGIAAAAREGKQARCTLGCHACCRQLVPVSTVEARALARIVAELPPAERDEVVQRFRSLVHRLEREGLLARGASTGERPMRARATAGQSAWDAVSRAYFRLHLDCPFLEGGACRIYDARPMACREYVVVTDPSLCETLDPAIEATPRGVGLGEVLAGLATALDGRRQGSLPLPLALEWARAQPPSTDGVHDGEALFFALAEAMDPQARKPHGAE